MTHDMNEKIQQNEVGGWCSYFGLKLNVHVQYNILKPIWPAPITLLAWKVRVTIC